ncbi:MAG: hypothetical protein EU981_05025 [Candidatus Liberibacter ctenarytainae]|uniref:Uncharacterized protein n=1 Tax=Candidatus Liberibacter ctenarytainae TaxID=2020335 RepID=A0A937DJG7_9HYPH|nr:hypothetical protein [Candidatus Liberibacter ctenarytainae]
MNGKEFQEDIEKLWTVVENLQLAQEMMQLSAEDIEKDREILKDLQLKCTEYVSECKKEIKNGLRWRNLFSAIVALYFLSINGYLLLGGEYSSDNPNLLYAIMLHNPNFSYAIMLHNSCLLLLPLISFFKSYGERNKNDYYPPAIKQALDIALKSSGIIK